MSARAGGREPRRRPRPAVGTRWSGWARGGARRPGLRTGPAAWPHLPPGQRQTGVRKLPSLLSRPSRGGFKAVNVSFSPRTSDRSGKLFFLQTLKASFLLVFCFLCVRQKFPIEFFVFVCFFLFPNDCRNGIFFVRETYLQALYLSFSFVTSRRTECF